MGAYPGAVLDRVAGSSAISTTRTPPRAECATSAMQSWYPWTTGWLRRRDSRVQRKTATCAASALCRSCGSVGADSAGGAQAATVWAAEHAQDLRIDPARIAVTGTSAGGNLAAVVAMMARDRGGPTIQHQVLFCPVIDHDFERQSYKEHGDSFACTEDSMRLFWSSYLGPDGDGSEPYASPIRAASLAVSLAPADLCLPCKV